MIISIKSNKLVALFKQISSENIIEHYFSEKSLIIVLSDQKIFFKNVNFDSLEFFAKSFQNEFSGIEFDGKVVSISLNKDVLPFSRVGMFFVFCL